MGSELCASGGCPSCSIPAPAASGGFSPLIIIPLFLAGQYAHSNPSGGGRVPSPSSGGAGIVTDLAAIAASSSAYLFAYSSASIFS